MKKIMLPDEVYDTLKWIALIVIPALGVAYYGLAEIWGLPYAKEIDGTLTVIATLLGVLLGVSCYNYNKKEEDNADAEEDV